MATDENLPPSLYEERVEQICSSKDEIFTTRTARFINPVAKTLAQAVVPLLKPSEHPKPLFKGWNHGFSLSKWADWVNQMAGKYSSVWVQAGILDGIMSSIYELSCNDELILGLLEFWSPESNTFVFPWGEATVTLEDVMILGGFSVLGDSVNNLALTEDLGKIVGDMNGFRLEMVRSKAKKASHSGWINRFMEKENEYEHMAFLSLWLSRFVFPSSGRQSIGCHVFPIAAKMSKGVRLALAPAVLAGIHHNLRILKEQPLNCINLLGPFQLVQLWAFERFPIVGPKSPNELRPGELRLARWDSLNSNLSSHLFNSAFSNPENFLWRPYAVDLKNWQCPSYYQESEQVVSDSSSLDEGLRSFFQFLLPCELNGLGCKEKHLPHRVAMQFGFDQDIPANLADCKLLGECIKFFVPSRSFQPGVSMRYSDWWRSLMLAREDTSVLAHNDGLVQKSPRNFEAALLGDASQFDHPRSKNVEEALADEFDDILESLRNICNATKSKIDSLKASNAADQQQKKRMVAGSGNGADVVISLPLSCWVMGVKANAKTQLNQLPKKRSLQTQGGEAEKCKIQVPDMVIID